MWAELHLLYFQGASKNTLGTAGSDGIQTYLNGASETPCMNSNFKKYWPVS